MALPPYKSTRVVQNNTNKCTKLILKKFFYDKSYWMDPSLFFNHSGSPNVLLTFVHYKRFLIAAIYLEYPKINSPIPIKYTTCAMPKRGAITSALHQAPFIKADGPSLLQIFL